MLADPAVDAGTMEGVRARKGASPLHNGLHADAALRSLPLLLDRRLLTARRLTARLLTARLLAARRVLATGEARCDGGAEHRVFVLQGGGEGQLEVLVVGARVGAAGVVAVGASMVWRAVQGALPAEASPVERLPKRGTVEALVHTAVPPEEASTPIAVDGELHLGEGAHTARHWWWGGRRSVFGM